MLTLILYHFSQTMEEEKTLLNSFYETSNYLDCKIRQRLFKNKKNYRAIPIMIMAASIFKKY